MALGTPTVIEPAQQFIATPYTTTTWTPTAGALVFVVVTVTGGASDVPVAAASDLGAHSAFSGGWNLLQQSNPGGTSKASIYIFYDFADSATTDDVTLTWPTIPPSLEIAVWEITGADTSTPIVGQTGMFTFLAAPSLNTTVAPTTADIKVGALASRNDSTGVTAGAGHTLLINYFHANPSAAMGVEYEGNATDTVVDFSGVSTIHTAMLAFIVKAAAGGTTPKHKVHTGASFTDSIRKIYNGSTWTETVSSIR